MQQIIFPAGLRIRPRHIKSAKGMRPHHRARAFAVQIKIAHVKRFFRLLNLLGIPRIHRPSQPKFRIIGDFQRMIESPVL